VCVLYSEKLGQFGSMLTHKNITKSKISAFKQKRKKMKLPVCFFPFLSKHHAMKVYWGVEV